MRQVLARVTRDEYQHSLLAWRFVQWAAQRAMPRERARLQRAFDTAIPEAAFALYVLLLHSAPRTLAPKR